MVHCVDRRNDVRRSIAVERRTLSPKPKAHPPARIRAVGVAAVEAALFPRSLADDVARVLDGRTTFPRVLWGEVI